MGDSQVNPYCFTDKKISLVTEKVSLMAKKISLMTLLLNSIIEKENHINKEDSLILILSLIKITQLHFAGIL